MNAGSPRPGLLLIVGLLGFAMRRFGLPAAPVVVGMILGPLAEAQLRRALAISDGDLTVWSIPGSAAWCSWSPCSPSPGRRCSDSFAATAREGPRMSAVMVGYVPSAEGRAALDRGIAEARLRGRRSSWSTRAGATPWSTTAICRAQGQRAPGRARRARHPGGASTGQRRARRGRGPGRPRRGGRRGPDRDRAPATLHRRQADPGQRGAAGSCSPPGTPCSR